MGKPKAKPGKKEKIRVKDKMVVDESDWTASSGVDAAAEREKSILQKLAELEKKQKEKEVEEKRAERQQKIQQSAIFNPNASPNTKIGKGTKVLSKKEKERRMKAAQKAQDFVEQLAAKASKSAQKHALRDKWKGLY